MQHVCINEKKPAIDVYISSMTGKFYFLILYQTHIIYAFIFAGNRSHL